MRASRPVPASCSVSPHECGHRKGCGQKAATPEIVFDLASRGTRAEDLDRKLKLYEQVLTVREYILSYPSGDYLSPGLQGYRLRAGRYVSIPVAEGRLYSEQFGPDRVVDGDLLRLYDPAAGLFLPNVFEAATPLTFARAQVSAETAARTAAQAAIVRLRALIASAREKEQGAERPR